MNLPRPARRGVPAVALVAVLAACVSTPTAPPPASRPGFDAVAAVAAIRAAGAANARELVIQPLADPQVEDLREQSARMQVQGRTADAAASLDRALALNADDPALLQQRAELALLQFDVALAEQLAQRALAAGSRVGPLCRQHWETVAQTRTVRAASAGAQPANASVADARRARDACTVSAPNRF